MQPGVTAAAYGLAVIQLSAWASNDDPLLFCPTRPSSARFLPLECRGSEQHETVIEVLWSSI